VLGMSDTHWGDEYFYADRNLFVQAMRERSAMKYSHDNNWSLHMAQMALQLANYKYNQSETLPKAQREYAYHAKARIKFYVTPEYCRAPIHYDEIDDSSKWAIY